VLILSILHPFFPFVEKVNKGKAFSYYISSLIGTGKFLGLASLLIFAFFLLFFLKKS